ncbi:MAG: hypothetical protein K2H01_07805 [Ruminococcus sp.]|nr:hypothetical protein [Ruminococcus sp.]
MSKINKSYRLSELTISYIESYAKENNLSYTAALERIVQEHQILCTEQSENIANTVVKKIESKYENMFTRMRLATTMSDRNVLVILEILNTLLIHDQITTAFTSNMTKSSVWAECEKVVKDQIAHYKQLKSNK